MLRQRLEDGVHAFNEGSVSVLSDRPFKVMIAT